MKMERKSKTIPVCIRMPEEVKERLSQLAEQDGRTLNGYVVRVITSHLKDIEKVISDKK